jgi:hypothetical protein
MDGAAPFLLGLHGQLLRLVCAHSDHHFEGLAVAGRHLFKKGAIDSATKKKLQNLDVVAAFLRHVSEPLCESIVARVGSQLKGESNKDEHRQAQGRAPRNTEEERKTQEAAGNPKKAEEEHMT